MRPIDADAVKEELSSLGMIVVGLRAGRGVLREFTTEYRKSVLRTVDEAPTLDLAPVVHGAIIESNENGKYKRVFSCCGTDFTQLTMWMIPNYCPNCGAKMDGGKKDD